MTESLDLESTDVTSGAALDCTEAIQSAAIGSESQPDSGICSHSFSVCHQKLLRYKSKSFPNFDAVDSHPNLFGVEELERNAETQTSSCSGQYIDDEIPDYSNLLLGRYVSYTGLLNSEANIVFDDIKFENILDIESDMSVPKENSLPQELGIYPEKCKVFGAGAYYGQVGVTNSFFVSVGMPFSDAN